LSTIKKVMLRTHKNFTKFHMNYSGGGGFTLVRPLVVVLVASGGTEESGLGHLGAVTVEAPSPN
jgi:hypothetical protein